MCPGRWQPVLRLCVPFLVWNRPNTERFNFPAGAKQGSKQSARCAPAESCSVRKGVGSAEGEKCPRRIKIATLKAQIAAYKRATAVVVWDKEQKNGVLQLEKLPPPGQGKDYQLWVIDPKNPQPVSAGILSVPTDGLIRTSFHPAAPIESADAFAISVEKKGGSAKPEGQIIFVGK